MGEINEERDGRLKRELGVSRRDLIRRGAVVGGTLVWAAPVIQSIGPAAFAQEPSPFNHFCCHCFNNNGARSRVTSTTGYCLSDGGVFPDAHPATDAHCAEHCTALGFDRHSFSTGPNTFGCSATHPSQGGGCFVA